MSITYPTTIDTLTNPVSGDTLDSPSHSDQHSDSNDAVEALEAKVGADSSAVTSSHDYILNTKDGGVASITGTETLTNKTLSTGSDIDTNVDVIEVLKKVYQVGCLYTSTVSTNPSTLFGFGTWAAFGSGKVLVGLDAGDADFNTVEETGGAKTHTLTIAELAAHTHTVDRVFSGTQTLTITSAANAIPKLDNTGDLDVRTLPTSSTGSGTAHSIVQPYITVYMFKRTA